MMVVFPSASWDTDVFPMDSMVWRVMGFTVTFRCKNKLYIYIYTVYSDKYMYLFG